MNKLVLLNFSPFAEHMKCKEVFWYIEKSSLATFLVVIRNDNHYVLTITPGFSKKKWSWLGFCCSR